jgi:N4-gp56 family major capsid protein
MANNTTINSELFQNLLVQSQYALYENSIARAVSTIYDYPVGAGKTVSVPIWAGITASKPGEGVAPSAVDANTNSKTIALEEHVAFAEVTDFLRDSAQENVVAALADQMGLALAESLDKELIALFGNAAITQEVGALADELTVQKIMQAAARIRANKYNGPLFAVVNPIVAYKMKEVLTATTAYTAISDIGNQALTNGFVGQIAGVTILEHALVNVDSQGQSVGCVFAPGAFGIAQRGGVAMETERNAAKRSTDVVETVVAGAGILRPELAVQIKANVA